MDSQPRSSSQPSSQLQKEIDPVHEHDKQSTCTRQRGSTVKEGEGASGMSSSATVLQTAEKPQLILHRVQNADLNHAPPEWLHRQSRAGLSFPHSLFAQFERSRSSELHPTSVALASHYPHLVGIMDVISDANNIKKLLKIPFSQSHVSIGIHRVGKTLLIDELTPAMLSQGANFSKLIDDLPQLLARKKHPVLVRNRNMFSKLLYYSVQEQSSVPMLPPIAPEEELNPSSVEHPEDSFSVPVISRTNDESIPSANVISRANDEVLPSVPVIISTNEQQQRQLVPVPTLTPAPPLSKKEEKEEEDRKEWSSQELPCSPSSIPLPSPQPSPQPFHRNVEWTIKDIRMLLGSDLPIFGRRGHPAISLRLHESNRPITVLTGLDCWLDNLMCNVPELAMCFHLNGVIEKYEVIKTEDIPLLDNSCRFSSKEVFEVAQNILSFLKANCTQEGHTYWLFRRKGDDLVKLYDLTSLQSFEDTDKLTSNPFAESVAMLFYRLSQNMLSNCNHTSSELATIKVLLENCIKLLQDNDSQLQVMVSAYYLLADLILTRSPCSSTDGSPAPSEDEREEEEEEEEEEGSVGDITTPGYLSVASLRSSSPISSDMSPSPVQPLVMGSNQDRSREALMHIKRGLDICSKGVSLEWCVPGQRRLLLKAAQAYRVLADAAMAVNRLGRSLRYTRMCILCCYAGSADSHTPQHKDKVLLMENLLMSWQNSGDIHCLSTKLSESFSSHLEEFRVQNPEDHFISSVTTSLCQLSGLKESCLQLHTDLETSLQRSVDCYKLAQELVSDIPKRGSLDSHSVAKSLRERLGNTWNELGVYYKYVATTLNMREDSDQIKKLWKSSYHCLSSGLVQFEATGSVVNQALLNANLGSLMRSCADNYGSLIDSVTMEEREELVCQQRHCYKEAVNFYIKGKEVLQRSSTHSQTWHSLDADLASVYYEMGRSVQTRPLSVATTMEEAEREIVMLMMKALQHAEAALKNTEKSNTKFPALVQCIGDCHHQLASLYQKTAFSYHSAQRRRQACAQSEKHYDKALQCYIPDLHRAQLLRVYLEKAFLFEQTAQGTHTRPKSLLSSLQCLLETRILLQRWSDTSTDNEPPPEDVTQLIGLLVHRLQAVLKQLLAQSIRKEKKDGLLETYKTMYTLSLKNVSSSTDCFTYKTVLDMFSSISNMLSPPAHPP